MDKWEEEAQIDREAVRRAIDTSYNHESAFSERLRQVEQNRDQLRAEISSLKAEISVLAVDSRKRNPVRNDVLV